MRAPPHFTLMTVLWGEDSYHAHLTEEDTKIRELTQGHTAEEGLTCLGAGQEVQEEEPGVSLWAHHMGFGALSL